MSDAGPGGRRPGEAEHRARRATLLSAVIDGACLKIGLDPYREGARIAKAIRALSGDSAGWALMARYARIGKPPSPLTIEALAQIYDMRAAVANVDF